MTKVEGHFFLSAKATAITPVTYKNRTALHTPAAQQLGKFVSLAIISKKKKRHSAVTTAVLFLALADRLLYGR